MSGDDWLHWRILKMTPYDIVIIESIHLSVLPRDHTINLFCNYSCFDSIMLAYYMTKNSIAHIRTSIDNMRATLISFYLRKTIHWYSKKSPSASYFEAFHVTSFRRSYCPRLCSVYTFLYNYIFNFQWSRLILLTLKNIYIIFIHTTYNLYYYCGTLDFMY